MSFHHNYPGSLSLEYVEDFLPEDLADDLYDQREKLDWPDRGPNRRANITFADKGLVYKVVFRDNTVYRKTFEWKLMPILSKIKKRVEKHTGLTFNFCAVMKYPHGNVIINKHQDKEMVPGTTIAGVSVGETRTIRFTANYWTKTGIDIDLLHGGIYIMHPPTNDKWFHEMVRNGKAVGCRYSLTFRNVPNALAEKNKLEVSKK